nr:hypothetical protein [Mycoplasmopsis bovis]
MKKLSLFVLLYLESYQLNLVPNNNNQINIKKYITYYVNKVMKNKFQDFKEIEDNTDLNEKYNTEEYKKKAGQISTEWLNKMEET